MAVTPVVYNQPITPRLLNTLVGAIQAAIPAVNVKTNYGAVGDGTTDDTAAFQAAVASGRTVYVPAGEYKLTSGIALRFDGQGLYGDGPGQTIFKPAGSFNVISLTNNGGTSSREGQWLRGFEVEASGMTGGRVIAAVYSDRFTVSQLVIWAAWEVARVQMCNVCLFENVWVNGVRGGRAFYWSGTPTLRSDLMKLDHVTVGFADTARGIGIEWDGNCHTLQCQSVVLVKPTYGVLIRNTMGGANTPQFGMFQGLEVDFPSLDGVRIENGEHFLFSPTLYIHGSTSGSGIYVAPAVPSSTVQVTGGKITSHARYGIENPTTIVTESGVFFSGNALGNISGTAKTTSKRFSVDEHAYFYMLSGDAVLNVDDADYMRYDRANDRFSFFAGADLRLSADPVRVDATVPLRLPSYTVATVPSAAVHVRSEIWVSNEAGGAFPAYSDGTNWLRPQDRAVIS